MRKNRTGNNDPLMGWGIGTAAAVCTVLGGVWLLAQMMIAGKVETGSERILIPSVLAAATIAGSQVNCILQNKRSASIPMITAAVMAVMLLIGGLLVDGPFCMAGRNLFSLAVGCAVSCVICLKKLGNRKIRKRSYR